MLTRAADLGTPHDDWPSRHQSSTSPARRVTLPVGNNLGDATCRTGLPLNWRYPMALEPCYECKRLISDQLIWGPAPRPCPYCGAMQDRDVIAYCKGVCLFCDTNGSCLRCKGYGALSQQAFLRKIYLVCDSCNGNGVCSFCHGTKRRDVINEQRRSAHPLYGAIAFSPQTRRYGYSYGWEDPEKAQAKAFEEAKQQPDTRIVSCAADCILALAIDSSGGYAVTNDKNPNEAYSRAIANCQSGDAEARVLLLFSTVTGACGVRLRYWTRR